MARVSKTRPETPRSKKKALRPSVTARISQLEARVDNVERTVVSRLAQFEATVLGALVNFSNDELKSRVKWRWIGAIIGVSIALILLGRMYGILGL